MDRGKGALFLVGTPIGNLGDITLRALETLKNVDIIAAEDTRQTQKLLTHYSIHKPVTSYHEHNKRSKGILLVQEMLQGKNIALVSDAGMPGISDPGCDLVKECIEHGLEVSAIPGPSALLAGVVVSSLDTSRFMYCGFLPRGKKERKSLLDNLYSQTCTLIFYESPHRLCNTLQDMLERWGDRQCCIAREITKIYEEYRRGTISEVLGYFEGKEIKGEITLMVAGKEPEMPVQPGWEESEKMVQRFVEEGLSKSDAVKETAKILGVSKRELYNRVMK